MFQVVLCLNHQEIQNSIKILIDYQSEIRIVNFRLLRNCDLTPRWIGYLSLECAGMEDLQHGRRWRKMVECHVMSFQGSSLIAYLDVMHWLTPKKRRGNTYGRAHIPDRSSRSKERSISP